MSYTIVNVVWDLIRGKLTFADKNLAKDRYAICQRCEVRNTKLNICTICGCFLPAKTKLKKSSCPMDLW